MTVTNLGEAPRKWAPRPSRQKGYKPKHYKRDIPAPNGTSVVSAKQFVPAINRIINRMEADRKLEGETSPFGVGVLGMICERGELVSRGAYNHDQLIRRLYGIREGETRLMRAGTAEAIAMGADTDLREMGVMELPAGMEAALDRVSFWFELELNTNGRKKPSPKVIRELAEDLFEFSKLMIHGPAEDYPTETREPEVNEAICAGLEALFAQPELADELLREVA